MWPIILIIIILASLYLIYLSVQNLGRRAFWRGLVYTAVLYLYSFGYVMLHNVDGIMFMVVMYILATIDLKFESKTEEDGA